MREHPPPTPIYKTDRPNRLVFDYFVEIYYRPCGISSETFRRYAIRAYVLCDIMPIRASVLQNAQESCPRTTTRTGRRIKYFFFLSFCRRRAAGRPRVSAANAANSGRPPRRRRAAFGKSGTRTAALHLTHKTGRPVEYTACARNDLYLYLIREKIKIKTSSRRINRARIAPSADSGRVAFRTRDENARARKIKKREPIQGRRGRTVAKTYRATRVLPRRGRGGGAESGRSKPFGSEPSPSSRCFFFFFLYVLSLSFSLPIKSRPYGAYLNVVRLSLLYYL